MSKLLMLVNGFRRQSPYHAGIERLTIDYRIFLAHLSRLSALYLCEAGLRLEFAK